MNTNEGLSLPEEVIAEETVKQPDFSPIDAASQVFSSYFPVYCNLLDKLSRKQIVRLNKALMGMPLEDVSPNLKNEVEVQAFMIGQKLFESKMVITYHVLTERQKEFEEKHKEKKEGE